MAQILKRCECKSKSKCQHSYTVRYWQGDRQREKSFKLNLQAAKKFAAEVEASKLTEAKTYGNPPAPVTFAEYSAWWLSTAKRAPGTMIIYRAMLKNHLVPVLGSRQLAEVAADRDGVTSLLTSLSAGVQRPAYSCLSALLTAAEQSGKVTVNRTRKIRLEPPAPRRELVFPDHDQMTKLAAGMGDLAPLVWIQRGCGLRPGEALALRKSDFTDGHLRVRRQQTRGGGADSPLKARGADAYRDVPVPTFVREIVDTMPDGPLFNVPTREFNQRFRTAADDAGLVGFRPHDLRHWFASVALGAGAPITDVAMWLGHRNVQVTFGVYGHLIPSSFDTARDALDQEYKDWQNAK